MAFSIFAAGLGAIVAGGVSLLSFGPGVGDFFSRTLNETFQQRIGTASDIINSWRRGDLERARRDELLHESGFDSEQIEILLQATSSPLTISEIITLWFRFRDTPGNRFGVSEDWLRTQLGALGVPEELDKSFVEANRPVPTLEDIIRFAIRDIFEPEVVKLGKLDENLPQLFIDEAGKRGFTREDAVNVWRAHWIFPSITQAFEMLHRLFDNPDPEVRFTPAEMDTFFNVADIAPGMRKRLQAIAFRPIGRVDIRRFDRLRVFGEGETRRKNLVRRFRELGFSPQDAEEQTRFTMQLTDRQRSPFTKAQVLKNFREGIPEENTESFAREQLDVLGFEPDEIDTLIAIEKERRVTIDQLTQIEKLREDFVAGTILSENTLRDRLNALDLSQSVLKETFKDIVEEAKRKLRRPTVTQADKLLQADVINENEWRKIMRANGFNRLDQDRLLELPRKEESTVQKLPSKSDVVEWLQNGLIDGVEFVSIMREIGFSRRFINLFALNVGVNLEEVES